MRGALGGKSCLQDIWTSTQLEWEDPLPQEIKDLWPNLFQDLKKIKGVVDWSVFG